MLREKPVSTPTCSGASELDLQVHRPCQTIQWGEYWPLGLKHPCNIRKKKLFFRAGQIFDIRETLNPIALVTRLCDTSKGERTRKRLETWRLRPSDIKINKIFKYIYIFFRQDDFFIFEGCWIQWTWSYVSTTLLTLKGQGKDLTFGQLQIIFLFLFLNKRYLSWLTFLRWIQWSWSHSMKMLPYLFSLFKHPQILGAHLLNML